MSDLEEEGWLRIGVAAALSREYAADHRRFLELVAGMLEKALPAQVTVRRTLLWRPPWRRVRELRLSLADRVYVLTDRGGVLLEASRTISKRGIALNTEELPIQAWIDEVSAALEAFAAGNRSVSRALDNLGSAAPAEPCLEEHQDARHTDS